MGFHDIVDDAAATAAGDDDDAIVVAIWLRFHMNSKWIYDPDIISISIVMLD